MHKKTRKQRTLLPKISFDVHACLLSRSSLILKTKNPSSTSGTKSSLRGTTQIRLNKQTLFVAVTGFPGADYFIHQRSGSCEQSGEFGLCSAP